MAYIDGFTVYYGLREKGWKHLYWLDYRALAERMTLEDQELVGVKYFTSRVTKPADSRKRQITYLEALSARGGVEIIEGKYEVRPHRCPSCGHKWPGPKEKMTDVHIATAMVLDALDDKFDTALLIAADADLVPAVRIVEERFDKRVVIISPRGRRSDELAASGSAHLHIRRAILNQCQLPEVVEGASWTYERPVEWNQLTPPVTNL